MRNNIRIIRFVFLLPVALMLSCTKDIIEEDITNKEVTLLAPANEIITTATSFTFWWENVDGALGYELQIADPSFSAIVQLALDVQLDTNKYAFTLSPGSYEWRVKAYNGSSSTAYTTTTLTVDTTSDISNQSVVLLAPTNNKASNNLTQTFKWEKITGALDYRLEIAEPDFNGTQVISPVIILADSAVHIFSSEGNYQWRVRGENNSSVTAYTTYSLEIDKTAPNTPLLVSPSDMAILSDNSITLYWDRGSVSGSAITDSVVVYSDSLLTTMYQQSVVSGTSYQGTFITGDYFWHVKSVDAAGNESSYSTIFEFTVQ